MKSGNLNFLEPSGPLQACNGTALLLLLLVIFTFHNIFLLSLYPNLKCRFAMCEPPRGENITMQVTNTHKKKSASVVHTVHDLQIMTPGAVHSELQRFLTSTFLTRNFYKLLHKHNACGTVPYIEMWYSTIHRNVVQYHT